MTGRDTGTGLASCIVSAVTAFVVCGAVFGQAPNPNPKPILVTDVNGVTVKIVVSDGQAGVIGDEVPSALPATSQPWRHFVTPKGPNQDDKVMLEARVTVPEGVQKGSEEAFTAYFQWNGGEPVPGAPLRRSVSRAAAGVDNVSVSVRGEPEKCVDRIRVWTVWTSNWNLEESDLTGLEVHTTPDGTSIGLGYRYRVRIAPPELTTLVDAATGERLDVPRFWDFAAGEQKNVPRVPNIDTDVYNHGADLDGGARLRWDLSRQMRQKVLNPGNIPDFKDEGEKWSRTTYSSYPTQMVCGNDDTADMYEEYSGIYAPIFFETPGWMFEDDFPTRLCRHSREDGRVNEGKVGDTFEIRSHFRAFSRLKIGNVWYVISPHDPWRVHLRFLKMQVNEVQEGKDMNGDGKLEEQLDIWMDNGTFRERNNDGWDDP